MPREPICSRCHHEMNGQGGMCAVEWCRCPCLLAEQRVVAAVEVDRQRAGGTRLGTGVWADAAGGLHFSIPEILPVLGLADTPGNRATVSRMMTAALARAFPHATLIEQIEES